MVVSAIFVVIIFVIVRFLALHYSGKRTFANGAGVLGAVIFCFGLLCYPRLFAAPAPALAPSAAAPPQPVAPQGQPVVPRKISLSKATIAALTQASGHTPLGSIDALTPNVTLMANLTANHFPAGVTIYARGWIADASPKAPVRGLVLIVDYKHNVDGTPMYGLDRPDVATAYSTNEMLLTGFSGVPIHTTGLSKGSHTVQAAAISDDGKHYFLIANPMTTFVLD